MKKISILVFACIMYAMPVFSAALSDNFCVNALGTICLSVNDIRDMADLKGSGNTKTDNAINNIINCMNDRFGLALDKDFEHIGTFITPSTSGGWDYIGYITGDFNSKQKLQAIVNYVLSLSEEAKFEKIAKGKRNINTIVSNGFRMMFMNPNIILFGKEETIMKIINGDITFGKAPEAVTKLLSNSGSFIQANGTALASIEQIPQIPPELATLSKDCSNISVYIKDLKLNFDLAFNNSENANNIKAFAEETKDNYLKENEKNLSEANDKLKQVSLKEFFTEAQKMYIAAKALDNIEQITVSQEDNFLHITAPYSRTQMTIGAIGVAAALVIPNFKKARETARAKACYSNMRVLLGAVEMYNLDNAVMMTELDMQKLVDGGYMRCIPTKPDPNCSYYSEGNLTIDGKIKCKLHGSIQGLGL